MQEDTWSFIVFIFRINPLSLVEIVAFVITQYKDPNEAVEFLRKTEAKVKSNSEAVTLCKVLIGQILLEKLNDQAATKVMTRDQNMACGLLNFVFVYSK